MGWGVGVNALKNARAHLKWTGCTKQSINETEVSFSGVPPVFEARSWAHGVMIGACVKSETTAAAEFKGKYLCLNMVFVFCR